MKIFKNYALYFAWVISLVGLLVSLFFGELLRYEPCRLCWYQRIFLFPLAFILAVAAYKNDRGIIPYAEVLSLLGGGFALYQVLELYLPILSTPALCGNSHDCADLVFELWGFVTFPLLSLIGFALIFALLWIAKRYSKADC